MRYGRAEGLRKVPSCVMNVSGRIASVFALQDCKDVGITHTGMRGMTSGGTNLPTAEPGVTGRCGARAVTPEKER